MFQNCLAVGVGGAVGSLMRYIVAVLIEGWTPASRMPFATAIVNLLGCFAIGVASGVFEKYSNLPLELRLLLVTGFLGGFTTFSAFAVEIVTLHSDGMTFAAIINVVLQVGLGVLLVTLGYSLAERAL